MNRIVPLVIALVVGLFLGACAIAGASDRNAWPLGTHAQIHHWTIDDGRTITCVFTDTGGVSCDWPRP